MLETIREYAAEMLAARGETAADPEAPRRGDARARRAGGAGPVRRGPARLARPSRARARQPARGARLGDRETPEPSMAARLVVRALAVLAAARLPQRGTRAVRGAWRRRAGSSSRSTAPGSPRPSAGSPTGSRTSRRPRAGTTRRSRLWRAIGDKGEIANALFNRAYADMIDDHGSARPTMASAARGRTMLEEALAIYRETGDRAGEGNILWGLGSYHYFTADAAGRGGLVPPVARAPSARPGSGRWRRGRCTCSALAAAGQRHWDEARDRGRHALRHFYEAGDVSGRHPHPRRPGHHRRRPTATSSGAGGCGAPRGTSSGRRDRARRLRRPELRPVRRTDPTGRHRRSAELERLAAEGAAMGFDEVVAYALEKPSAPSAPHVETPA